MNLTSITAFGGLFLIFALIWLWVLRRAIRNADPTALLGRLGYTGWWFGIWLGSIIGGLFVLALTGGGPPGSVPGIAHMFLSLAISAVVVVLSVRITVYRLRDAFLDIRWAYLLAVPIVSLVFGIVLMFIPSDYGLKRRLARAERA